ncbi:Dynein heavy chain 10, axonemal [Apis cerana cerana]|uniref:Dynein heavy chain 10, axonemal n=1 Tax=Apis cerana cerana TaxID=94128 RepID=A0A2A3EQH9_APICC|nr:Dynein heavy chain 10, axonemal [Apis cerana cerana]
MTESEEEITHTEDEEDLYDLERPSIIHLDYRVMWIRNKVMKFLGIPGYEIQFYKLLNANNRYLEDKLLNFLILDLYGITSLERKIIFFYCTYSVEKYQEEVPIWQTGKPSVSKLAALTALAVKGKSRKPRKKEEEPKKKKKKAKKPKKAPKAPEKSVTSTIDDEDYDDEEEEEYDEEEWEDRDVKKKDDREIDFVPPPGEEDKYIMTKSKKVTLFEIFNVLMVRAIVRKTPILHMFCGEVDGSRPELQEVTLFYFMRTTHDGIPNFDSYSECDEQMTHYLIVGSLNGKFLISMHRMVTQVFRPLINSQFRGSELVDIYEEKEESAQFRKPSEFRRMSIALARIAEPEVSFEEEEEKEVTKVSHMKEIRISLHQNKNDFLSFLDKLTASVEWTLEHIEGDILLTMPNIPELDDPNVTDEMLEKNKEIIMQLEDVIMLWGVHIEKVVETFQMKVPVGKGPIAESDYWKDREIGLLMLVEQLKTPMAKRILNVLNKIKSTIASNFQFFYSDLWKTYTEARDNNRFLSTILRHFKLMTESRIRMIWVLSPYYCVEERMVSLMERISWQLSQNVIKNLSINMLFRHSWKQAYLKSREDIEISGKGKRWEFDQKRLFQGTEYIASSIISDPAQIDTFNKENWEATLSLFFEEVLMKFKDVKTRASIHQQLMKKFDVVMQQFSKEVSTVEGIFNRGKRSPPLKPVLTIQNVAELKYSHLKILAFNQYYDLSKQLKSYEESKFQQWMDKAQMIVINTMRRNILMMMRSDPDKGLLPFPITEKPVTKNIQSGNPRAKSREFLSPGSTPQESVQKGDYEMSKPSIETGSSGITRLRDGQRGGGGFSSHRDQKSGTSSEKGGGGHHQIAKITWTEFMSGSILIECQLRFQVNFDWNLFEIIHEAELMEQLGFELSPIVKDASIQKNRLRHDLDVMQKLIDQYNSMLEKMDKADIELLKNTLLDIEKHIQPGCEKLLKNLNSLNYDLFSLPIKYYDDENQLIMLLPCKVFFQEIQAKRTELATAMSVIYRSTSPILIKLESLIFGTYTGKCAAMQLYYEKYEKKIFSAFITCITKNLEYFNKKLTDMKPMFQVDANGRNLLEQVKLFPRWMSGTCLECKPQRKAENDTFVNFTFFEDLMSIQMVNDAIITIQRTAHKLAFEAWQYLQSNILDEVMEMNSSYNLYSISINLSSLLFGIEQHAKEWKQVLGDLGHKEDGHPSGSLLHHETFLAFRSHGISASTLESTSDRFSGMTQDQIYDFVRELEEFAKDFEAHGPGSVGDDLELGLVKMEEYGKLIAKHDETHRNLVNSEILFDLPATDYSVFLKLKKDYDGMELLFELYKEQREMRDVWAQTLWVNLNPQQLIEGMDHFIRIFRKLPKFVKELSIGHALEANMKSFKNSVPLFIELKNEAMRDRHWKQLMTKTGQFFDMDPERCDDNGRKLEKNCEK